MEVGKGWRVFDVIKVDNVKSEDVHCEEDEEYDLEELARWSLSSFFVSSGRFFLLFFHLQIRLVFLDILNLPEPVVEESAEENGDPEG